MPTWYLQRRASGLLERMDDPSCDPGRLRNTYRQFGRINALFSAWQRIYTRYLRPHFQATTTLLDVGCGGGDVVRQLASWAAQDGFELHITAIDPDARALSYAKAQRHPETIRFLQTDTRILLAEGESFDIVISNHLLHHLSESGLKTLCRDSERLATRLAVHNDIRRSDLAYLGFSATRPFFRRSFVTEDGLTSIRRSFTARELRQSTPDGWSVVPFFPYRNLLIYRS